jgi:hypothetical protein
MTKEQGDSPRAREEGETTRDEGELRARAASVKANPSPIVRLPFLLQQQHPRHHHLPPTYNTTNRH